MDEQAEGLRFDYKADNGNFLLVDRNPPLSRADMNPIEVQMLHHNKFPRLLPIQFEEVDRNVRLLYDIGGKKMLSHRLRREQLTQEQYLRIMLHTVIAIADCRGYMLDEQGLLLQFDHIFTGTDIEDLYFTYIPILNFAGKQPIQESFRAFSAQCLGSVKSMEGQAIPRVLSIVRDEGVHHPGLKELLLTLLLECTPASSLAYSEQRPAWIQATQTRSEQSEHTQERSAGSSPTFSASMPISPVTIPSAPLVKPEMTPQGFVLQHEPASGPVSWLKRIRELKDEVGPSMETGELPLHARLEKKTNVPIKAKLGGKSGKKLLYVIVAALALIGLIWSFYSEASSTFDLVLMAGLSGLVLLTIVLLLRIRPSWLVGRLDDQSKDRAEHRDKNEDDYSEESMMWNNSSIQLSHNQVAAARSITPISQDLAPIPYNPSTVLLDMDVLRNVNDIQTNHYSLSIRKESGTDKVLLTGDNFIIGREEGGVNYSLEGAGVSKHHLELIFRDGTYCAQDLGSTNGTLLNGERMAPYKPYPLSDGDRLGIIRTQFVFKKE